MSDLTLSQPTLSQPEVLALPVGHRPPRLGGFKPEVEVALLRVARAALATHAPDRIITGMSPGFEQALAQAALDLKIPYVAALRYRNQDSTWPASTRRRYESLLETAADVRILSESNDTLIVDSYDLMAARSDGLILSLWDGSVDSRTGASVRFLQSQGLKIVQLWGDWLTYLAVREE